MENEKVRRLAAANSIRHWQIAQFLGVTEPTMTRWLRYPLPAEKEAKIRAAIKEIAGEGFVNV